MVNINTITRSEYMQAYCSTQDSSLKLFEAYYSQYVTPSLIESIPAGLLDLCASSEDYHYNDIGGCKFWDMYAYDVPMYIDKALLSRNGEVDSLAVRACIYKQAVRQALLR